VADLEFSGFRVHEAEGAWELLREVLRRSDPAREGGPEFYVPDQVRTALKTALIDGDDKAEAVKSQRELIRLLDDRNDKVRALLARARRVLPETAGLVPLRCAIDEVMKHGS